ncbi:hypothetical protein [Chitinophaga sp. Cy-1792]|uniref:hypothetical protein n=1 Tax=Chitinophaga sp. Cy-1792 TaxID=2608339 RepID=UPI00141DFA8E|nr:hypothetical protein [Chitinophaga sp. Cy-1792]NIG55944.1 hypothetical protein [Chitinophaga sp. Cy-1792]
MKGFTLLFLLFVPFAAFAQNTVNNYKYVIVPEKFSFQKDENQYGLNSTTQMVLGGKGFSAVLDNKEMPTELAGNRCSALTADVIQRKALFVTNLTFILKDCQGNILFKSKEGKSREKDYAASYNEALRDALSSIDTLHYEYNGTTYTAPQPSVAVQSRPAAPVVAPAPAQAAAMQPAPATAEMTNKETNGKTLYAQATANGYQLVDTSPKIVLTLYKSTAAEYFIADSGTDKGIVLKHNGDWYFEYYKDGKLITEKLNVKF